jgi:ABC-type molybdate transport system substrate-binding protein
LSDKRTSPPRLLFIRWIDAQCEYTKVWHSEEDVPSLIKPVEILTVGYVVAETADYLTVAQSYNNLSGEFAGVHTIPQPLIKESREIRLRNRTTKEAEEEEAPKPVKRKITPLTGGEQEA